MELIQQTFVINMDSSTQRLASFEENVGRLGIKFTRWPATNGYELTAEQRWNLSSPLCKTLGCAPGVIGCYLSHINLLKSISRRYSHERDPMKLWFLIFEDDANPHPQFEETLWDLFQHDLDPVVPIWQHNPFPDMVQLGRSCKLIPHKRVSPRLDKVMFANGTTCYLVNLKGVNRIIDELGKHVFFHIDVSISLHNIALYRARGDYLLPHSHLDSTISSQSFPRTTTALISLMDTNLVTMFSSTVVYYGNGFINLNIGFVMLLIIAVIATKKKQFWIIWILMLAEILFWIR